MADSWADRVARGAQAYERGFYREAIMDFEGALPLAATTPDRFVTFYRLAVAHGKLAEYAPAERDYKSALALAGGPSSLQAAIVIAGLGEIYRAQLRLADSLASEHHALAILKHLGMLETEHAASVFTIEGEVLSDQHRFKAAEQSMRQALAIHEKIDGPDNPELATSLNNLGVILAERNRPEEAEALLQRSLRMREAHFGGEHPMVANTLLSLSSVYADQKRYAEAAETARRSLEMMQRLLPASHPDVIKAHVGLAMIARKRGDLATAIAILEEAAGNVDSRASAAIPEYAQLYALFARYLEAAGEKARSREVRLEARQAWERLAWTTPVRTLVTSAH